MAGSGHRADERRQREWLLHCEGMAVEGPEGFVGRVVEALYEHSARWDRPWALAVRGQHGVVNVPMDAIAFVDAAEARIRLDRAPGSPTAEP